MGDAGVARGMGEEAGTGDEGTAWTGEGTEEEDK